jgi:ubiquinone/menaquinone biosynthesis C-methylase UbiE
MSVYGRVFAALYDRMMAGTEDAGMRDRRAEVVGQARGRVLEIGAGTGLNLDHYGDGVTELVLAEPEAPMARRLREKLVGHHGPPATVVEAPAEKLPYPDDHFDTVVTTLVLCTVNDPEAALAEIDRVLCPGGRLLFLEHVRSDDPKLARWQDRIAPAWRHVGHGCHANRDTPTLLDRSRLEVERLEHGRLPKAPPFVRPLIAGSAIAPRG